MTNTYRYLPDTEQDVKEMLDFLGISSVDELFEDIPEELRLQGELDIPAADPEPLLRKKLTRLAAKNVDADQYPIFLGAGIYDHYIPSHVKHIVSRQEFYTAYTPYQPEISQGELQAIFEFQTMVAELTGMEVANSSMYDGQTSLAEAASLAVGQKKRKKVLVSQGVHPESRQVLNVVAKGQNYAVEEVALANDVTDLDALKGQISKEVAAVIVQYPNFLGSIEDLAEIKAIAEENGALFIVSANPLALALLQAPGKFGADIVVGDMQPLGIPMNFGGPACGYFAATKKLIRKLPGRIVGQSTDDNGNRGFVLTLQAREQHIRREKATSNICSNQALNALTSAITMASLGKHGIREMAQLNIEKADYAARALQQKGFNVINKAPFFNEFVVELSKPVKEVNEKLLEQGIIGGYDLGKDYEGLENHMLVAVTDQRTKEEIDQFINALEVAVNG